jgi:purine-binding chemotaxis protein CheW
MSTKSVTKSSLAVHKQASAPVLLEMCSVRVGSTLFGLPITHILEIVGHTCPQDVPLAPEFVGGLVHYRGDVLTTVSLRQLLGLSRQNANAKGGNVSSHDIIVLESSAGCFGLLVDSVGEVLTVSSSDHELNPSTLDAHRSALFAGAYKLQQGLLVMLDPERLDPMHLGAVAA